LFRNSAFDKKQWEISVYCHTSVQRVSQMLSAGGFENTARPAATKRYAIYRAHRPRLKIGTIEMENSSRDVQSLRCLTMESLVLLWKTSFSVVIAEAALPCFYYVLTISKMTIDNTPPTVLCKEISASKTLEN
jgi:hypothetical protein